MPHSSYLAKEPGRDRGVSLVEILICVVLMSTAVLAIVNSLTTATIASSRHRSEAVTDIALRSGAEAIIGAATAYTPCATITTYASMLPNDPNGRVVLAVQKVEYWDGTANIAGFTTACSTDTGAQRITLQAQSRDNKVVDTLLFIKRRSNS